MPAVLLTGCRGGDGEGEAIADGGQCVELLRSELGSELGEGPTGPGEVAVVRGSDGDDVVGIEVVPGDLSGRGELSGAIGLIGGACVLDEGDFRPVVGACEGDGDGFDRIGGVIGGAGVIDGDDVEGEGECFARA